MIRAKLKKDADESDGPEINLSPLIDCVFILLIFYIVTTVFVEETGVEVNKPDAAASVQLAPLRFTEAALERLGRSLYRYWPF